MLQVPWLVLLLMLAGQLLIDFTQELRRPPPGWRYCPCARLVALDEGVYAEDAAGNMRSWHVACRALEKQEQHGKRMRAAAVVERVAQHGHRR